jgi:hypothetical protein
MAAYRSEAHSSRASLSVIPGTPVRSPSHSDKLPVQRDGLSIFHIPGAYRKALETLLRSIGGSGPPRSSSGRFQERPVVGPVGSLFHFGCPIPVEVRTDTQTCREICWNHLSKLFVSSSDYFPALIFEFLALIISKRKKCCRRVHEPPTSVGHGRPKHHSVTNGH